MCWFLFVFFFGIAFSQAQNPETSLYEQAGEFRPQNRIDELLRDSLAKKKITPAPLCSDAVFVRRIYLDLTGTLPAPADVRAFLGDDSPDKRNSLIDKLLNRPEYIDYQTMLWCDVLRVKAEFPINLWPNGALCYYNWIRSSVRTNKPYDQFARELLTSGGSNFRDGAANFFRAVPEKNAETLAESVSQTFLGERTSAWSDEKRADLALFFSRVAYKGTAEWKEEIVYWDRRLLDRDMLTFPDGSEKTLPPNTDPRTLFADWLVNPKNKAFNRCIANRIWFWLLGRGLVHEPDDFRADNPAVHPELLDYLADELVHSKYNMKHLYRLIVQSAAYQQSAIAREETVAASEVFAVYPIRRLEAEVLQDALSVIFDSNPSYGSEVPEPFTYVPPRYRTVVLPDGSITSPFLEMFGRSSRDTGLTTDRDNRVTAAQQLFLLNSTEVNNWVQRMSQNLISQFRSRPNQGVALVDTLWLRILSRPPSSNERRLAIAQIVQNQRLNESKIQDIIWVLLNTDEFLCRH